MSAQNSNPSSAATIIRARHLGMCFGVRDAISLALDQAALRPLTIVGDLVHNPEVLATLRASGIAMVASVAEVRTETMMVTAHGASERMLAGTRSRGLAVVEATCPLVRVAHRAIQRLRQEGYHLVIVGQRGHVEVRGLTEDLDDYDVILEAQDVEALAPHPRLGVAAQTTQPLDKVRHLVDLMRARFPQSEVRLVDTVCQPTKLRQHAAVDLAARCDVVIVIGGAHSNNTRELVDTCRRHCPEVHHVQAEEDLDPAWFRPAATVGITAGTSTPDAAVDRVDRRIRELVAGLASEAHPVLSGGSR